MYVLIPCTRRTTSFSTNGTNPTNNLPSFMYTMKIGCCGKCFFEWRNSLNRLSQLVDCTERSVSAITLDCEPNTVRIGHTQHKRTLMLAIWQRGVFPCYRVFVIVFFFCVCTANGKKDKGTDRVILCFN